MPFVLDASLALAWAFEDETDVVAENVLRRMSSDAALVPWLWWFEVRNGLLTSERKGRGSVTKTEQALVFLNDLRIAVDIKPDEDAIFRLSRRHGLTFYDAAYLDLARRNALALATLDQALVKAARAERVPLIGR